MKFFLVSLVAATLLPFTGVHPVHAIEDGTQRPPTATNLKPGEYTWDAAAANDDPAGAIAIIVSLGDQNLGVYRNGVLVGRSTISSGRKDFETPHGIYMIVEKNRTHHSNKYHEASMPYMERLTWSGLAIHAGNTPGHPESHGCMHVPEDFAKDLYGYTQLGNTVLIAQGVNKPVATAVPNALFAGGAKADAPAPVSTEAKPDFVFDGKKVASGAYTIAFSSADKRAYVFRKEIEIGRADLAGLEAGKKFGDYVYVASDRKTPEDKTEWTLLGKSDDSPAAHMKELAKDLVIPPGLQTEILGVIQPGTTLVVTDSAVKPDKPADANPED